MWNTTTCLITKREFDKTDIKCKTFKCEIDYDDEEMGDSFEEDFSIDSDDFTLSEDVVVGDYTKL